jgi:nicotinamidase-related amidase
MTTTLILIDIQNDYFAGGRNELENPIQAAAQASKLLAFFRRQNWPSVHIQHIANRPDADFFLPDTEGVKIHEAIVPLAGETVLVKHFPNSFRATGLLEHLQGLKAERLVICGMMTHMCVDATVRAAADLGFTVLLAADACATRALAFENMNVPAEHVQAAFLAALKSYAVVSSTQEVLEKLLLF